ncbi:hypothetical protein GF371_00270, partial [Candidatus Woesearchaeota archaeon]|nr:hypothetical protein [Candidatus Woesearchaeota archaeon]
MCNSCYPNTKRCHPDFNNRLQQCSLTNFGNYNWQTIDICSIKCEDAACYQCPTPCALGDVRCNGDQRQRCEQDNNGCYVWTNVGQVCSLGCGGGLCYECSPGTKRCHPDFADRVQTCTLTNFGHYNWKTTNFCDYDCNPDTNKCNTEPPCDYSPQCTDHIKYECADHDTHAIYARTTACQGGCTDWSLTQTIDCYNNQFCSGGSCIDCSEKCDGVCISSACYGTDPDCDWNGQATQACCGNNVCEFWENHASCPNDCANTCPVSSGDSEDCECDSHSDCPNSHPFCEDEYPRPTSIGYDACLKSEPISERYTGYDAFPLNWQAEIIEYDQDLIIGQPYNVTIEYSCNSPLSTYVTLDLFQYDGTEDLSDPKYLQDPCTYFENNFDCQNWPSEAELKDIIKNKIKSKLSCSEDCSYSVANKVLSKISLFEGCDGKNHQKIISFNTDDINYNINGKTNTGSFYMQLKYWKGKSPDIINSMYNKPKSISKIKKIDVKVADSFECEKASDCESNICLHGYCRSSIPFCGDDYCDAGETKDSCMFDCGYSGEAKGASMPCETESD